MADVTCKGSMAEVKAEMEKHTWKRGFLPMSEWGKWGGSEENGISRRSLTGCDSLTRKLTNSSHSRSLLRSLQYLGSTQQHSVRLFATGL